jgi:hypothetical protein
MMGVVWGCQKAEVYEQLIKPELVVRADQPRFQGTEIVFDSDTVYVLASSLEVGAGSRLILEPGTLVKVRNNLTITVRPGARIEARGTANEPVVFTSDAANGAQGIIGSDGAGPNSWNGLHIYGSALTQPGTSSGVLSHVRIEFAGGNDQFTGLPSLLFEHVDAATELHHIQVSYSFRADAIRFSGGNADASYLVTYATNGQDFSLVNGYKGRLQHLLAYRHPFFPLNVPGPAIAGMSISGSSTNPAISNLTVLGPVMLASTSLGYKVRFPSAALLVSGGARFQLRNSVLMGFPSTAFHMGERQSALALQQGLSEFSYNAIHSDDLKEVCRLPGNVFPPFVSSDFLSFVLNPSFGNQLVRKADDFQWLDPYAYDTAPNPAPAPSSPMLTGANFSGALFTQSFFNKVPHLGAIGTDQWLEGWSNFIPLQTVYNK